MKGCSASGVIEQRALIVLAALASLHCADRRPASSPPVPVRIAVVPAYYSLPIYVAQERRLFERHGLDVTLQGAGAGLVAIEQLAEGHADFATVREFAFVQEHLTRGRPQLQIVASLASSTAEALVARRDRGIRTPADLRGKRVAAPLGGFLHFNLTRFLLLHRIAPSDVLIFDVPLERCLDAVTDGDADAAMLIENYRHAAETRLGERAQLWTQRTSLPYHWVLVGNREALATRPDVSRRLVAALFEAEQLALADPASAEADFVRATGRPPRELAFARETTRFALGLDQALIVAMEDQARWLHSIDPTTTSTMPNYLSLVFMGALSAVRPDAITIFH